MSGEHALAAALIELIVSSPPALERLVELLEDRGLLQGEPTTPLYTVASLAEALKVSPKVVRGAIARGELDAVKRGGRWIISARASTPGRIRRSWRRCGRRDVLVQSRVAHSVPRSRCCRGRVLVADGYDLL
jgi:hypothetical protein